MVKGIVLSIRRAEEMKSELRNAAFALKKLERLKSNRLFSKDFMETVEASSKYYATSLGETIRALIPEYLLKSVTELEIPVQDARSEQADEIVQYAVQGSDEERYGTWKSLIRQEFAQKHSILFVLPTIEEAEATFEMLKKGVEKYAFVLHGSLTKNEIVETWNNIVKEEHSVVIVATYGFLSIPRHDIKTIVLERESNRAYKIPHRPFLDIRKVVKFLAEKKRVRLFVADEFLRIETLWRKNEGEVIEATPFKLRSLGTANQELVDVKDKKNEWQKTFDLIRTTREENSHMFIFCLRKGLSTIVICEDCGTVVTCNNCAAPVVLHNAKTVFKNGNQGPEKRFFMCHRCGERRSAEEYCKNCQSWKLKALGIGIDMVEEKIREEFSDLPIFRLDGEKNVKSLMQKFRAKPGSVLIGTEAAISFIHDKVENSSIFSIDSLFSLPDFRIEEKIFYIITRIRALTSKNIILETRKPEERVFEYGLKGNISDFYRDTIEDRKKFNYPPFTILIKITIEGKKDKIVFDMKEAQEILAPYEVEVFPAFTETIKSNYVLHGLIRVQREKWVDENLLFKLRSLKPQIEVRIDPDSLL